MRHTREEVIIRTIQEFKRLDHVVANLTDEQWKLLVLRPETKDPWTVKDALAHITYWKADIARSVKRLRLPIEQRGLNINDGNHLIYMQWRERSAQEVLAWHRQVQEEVLAALRQAPEAYFNSKERNPQWPYDLEGHSIYHRVKDIERVLQAYRPGDK